MENAAVRNERSRHRVACAGEFSAQQTWKRLAEDRAAILLDVRTQPEWALVGEPDVSGLDKKVVKLSWRVHPAFALNPDFIQTIKALVPEKTTPLYILCRSGGRSYEAACALTAEGFSQCYNVSDGFEGGSSPAHGQTLGWKAANLPWRIA